MAVSFFKIGNPPIGKMIRQTVGWMIIFALGGILAGMIGGGFAPTTPGGRFSPRGPFIGALLGGIKGGFAGAVAGWLYGIVLIIREVFRTRKKR